MSVATAEAPAKVAAKLGPIGPIGPTIDKLHALREKKRALEAEVKKIEGEYAGLEEQLMEKLSADGLDKATGKAASVSITSNVVGNVVDWDALNKYIKRTGYFHLYQRRVSDPACRELFETKGSIPGVEPFTKKRLNLRSL